MSECPVCQRALIREDAQGVAGGRSNAHACERRSQRKLAAMFQSAMATYRTPEGLVPEWAAAAVLQTVRKLFYLKGYTAGYHQGLARGRRALNVERETTHERAVSCSVPFPE